MLKNRRFWIIIILLLIAAGGGYWYYTTSTASVAADEEEPELQTAVASRGDIVVSATGAGTVIAAQEIELAFATGGTLTELLVRVGDDVQTGDELAKVDDTDAQQTLVNAQIQLTQAKMQTDASATEIGISYDDISVEQAQINLDEVQAALDDLLNWEPDADEIAQLEAQLASAQAGYNAARGQEASSSYNIQIEQMSLQQAEQDVADAYAAYDLAYDPGREWELYTDDPSCRTGESYPNCTGELYSTKLQNERESAENAIVRAEENLELAQISYNQTLATTNNSSSVSAQSNVLSAELALETAKNGPTEDEIEAAETAVHQAELSLQQTLLNRESNVLSLTQAELNVTSAQEAVDGTVLTAPIDGTVTAVNYSVGETAGSSVIILADLTQPLLEVYLDESDMSMVGMAYEVEVVFDALPDDTFIGTVVQIDPELVNESGITAVRALVQLDPDSFAKPQTLPIGMNATVEVIGGKSENTVLVPVEALRELDAGQYAVFVMENGEPKLRMVEVGIMDFTSAEIISGVEAGEEVTTGIVQTQ
ncbi:MAG: efflux RND transporter periplasmic adaptor subunit [Anaerolineales bacterium]|nr:efflux RND transporter periplasmic adaptor subunit [Anaerolineales bacterium]